MNGKIAIVTGGTRGIGLSTCLCLARDGFQVVSCARHEVVLPNQLVFHAVDISNPDSCDKLVKDILFRFSRIDVLVNNAGIICDSLTTKMSLTDFEKVIDTNLIGTFNMTRSVIQPMAINKYGSIVNVASVVGEFGNIGQSNYSASKAGIIGMTKTWAKEFSRHGENIRVNAVAPGFISTDMLSNVPEDYLLKITEKTCLKRLGDPDEVAEVISFLASDKASYVTGAVFDVNGGLVL